jgi:hypothetical protein
MASNWSAGSIGFIFFQFFFHGRLPVGFPSRCRSLGPDHERPEGKLQPPPFALQPLFQNGFDIIQRKVEHRAVNPALWSAGKGEPQHDQIQGAGVACLPGQPVGIYFKDP